jgi:hypothetical protein
MTPLTAEWVSKAEGDRATALRELRVNNTLNYDWETLRHNLRTLTIYAINFRYPGDAADQMKARDAVRLGRRVRLKVRRTHGLSK